MNKTNWLAVIASAVAGMGIGFLWYGLFFNAQWMTGNGITTNEDRTTMFKDGAELPVSMTPMIVNFVGMVVFAIILNWLINRTNHTTGAKGATLGGVIGLIAAINIFLSNMFAFNPSSLTMIDGSYIIVVLAVMGLILGGWRKG